jgi:hypothetical protein
MPEAPDLDAPRYAVYYAPAPGSPLACFGERWLRGDAVPDGLGADAWQAMLREPRRYGFHATLRPPLRLAAGVSESDFLARVAALARRWPVVPLGALAPQALEGYVALVPVDPPAVLQALAADCVTGLDALRAPLVPAERARRAPHRLDDRGRALLERYGYPQVLERFRFHMTLATFGHAADAARIVAAAHRTLGALSDADPPLLDRLCVFVEPRRGAPFERRLDLALQA